MPVPQLHLAMSKLQTFEPYTPCHTRRQACQSMPVPLSLIFALCTSHTHSSTRPHLMPLLCRSSTCALPQPRAHHHRPSKSRHMSGGPRCSFASCRACDDTHDPNVPIRAWPVLQPHPMPRTVLNACLAMLTLPAFDADLLSAAPLTLTHLTLLADTHPFVFFDQFLAAHPQIAHLTL